MESKADPLRSSKGFYQLIERVPSGLFDAYLVL
jgi:hypothetical protein